MRIRAALLMLVGLGGCPRCESTTGLDDAVPLATPAQELVEFGVVVLPGMAERTVEVHSDGTGPLTIRGWRLDGSGAFTADGPGGIVLAPGGTARWNAVFTPAVVGEATAELIVESDARNRPELRIRLRGHGANAPACDDANPCTDDRFDALLGQCISTFNLSTCDDRNACTRDDRCVGGRCLGVGVVCADTDACTRDLCDATTGCVFITDARACDDAEPCTAETCDSVAGCGHVSLPDNTPCSLGANTCVAAATCQAGRCTGAALPDGSPCTDFLACTIGDRCVGGVCTGTLPMDAQVSSRLHAMGTRTAVAVASAGYWLVTAEEHERSRYQRQAAWLGVADARATPLAVTHALPIEGMQDVTGLVAGGSGTVVVVGTRLTETNRWHPVIVAADIGVDGAISGTRRVELAEQSMIPVPRVAARGDWAWVCSSGRMHVVHLSDGTTAEPGIGCTSVAVDEASGALYTAGEYAAPASAPLERWSTANPVAPVREAVITLSSPGRDLVVAPGLGLFENEGGDTVLHDATTLQVVRRWDDLANVVPAGSGRAYLLRGSSITLVERVSGTWTETLQRDLPNPVWANVWGARAGNYLAVGAYAAPLRFFVANADGTLAPGDATVRGLGGFQLVRELDGVVTGVAPEVVHRVELAGTDLRFTSSRPFSRLGALVSFGEPAAAPAWFVHQLEHFGTPVGSLGGAGAWLDGRAGASPDVRGLIQVGLGPVAGRDGRVFHAAATYVASMGQGSEPASWLVRLSTHDTTTWTPSAGFAPVAVAATEVTWTQDRAWQQTLLRASVDGRRVLLIGEFVRPGDDNVLELAAYDVVSTVPVLAWQARLPMAPFRMFDVGVAGDDVFLTLSDAGEYRWAHRVEHHRWVPADGTMRLQSSLESPGIMTTLRVDERVVMSAAPEGMRVFGVDVGGLTVLGQVPLAAPALDVEVAQDRLWVTTQGTLDVFYPPCPPPPVP